MSESKRKCECCQTQPRNIIAITYDGDKLWFCRNCEDYLADFLNDHTATKWIEIFRDEVELNE